MKTNLPIVKKYLMRKAMVHFFQMHTHKSRGWLTIPIIYQDKYKNNTHKTRRGWKSHSIAMLLSSSGRIHEDLHNVTSPGNVVFSVITKGLTHAMNVTSFILVIPRWLPSTKPFNSHAIILFRQNSWRFTQCYITWQWGFQCDY